MEAHCVAVEAYFGATIARKLGAVDANSRVMEGRGEAVAAIWYHRI
jgi:hypothetical protein